MYERSYGYRYDEPEQVTGKSYASAADIAKMIRADIKQAIAEGLLPSKPVTYSVRARNFAGGCAIDVEARGWPEAWQQCEGIKVGTKREHEGGGWTATACSNHWCKAREDRPGAEFHEVLTEEGQVALMTLERIHGAYNHDGSESMVDYFDVRYYGHAEIETAWSAKFRADQKAKKAAQA